MFTYPRVVTRMIIMIIMTSDVVAVHLHDVSDLGNIDKLVDESLTVHLGQDASLVVISEQDVVTSESTRVSIWSIFEYIIVIPLPDNKEGCDIFSVSRIYLPESATHRLVVHVWLVLVEAPQPGHRLAVHQLEDALLPVNPLDEGGAGAGGLEQGEEELPQVGRARILGLFLRSSLTVTDFKF